MFGPKRGGFFEGRMPYQEGMNDSSLGGHSTNIKKWDMILTHRAYFAKKIFHFQLHAQGIIVKSLVIFRKYEEGL